MPYFIKRPSVQSTVVDPKTGEEYTTSRLRNYKLSELMELWKTSHHMFIEVPEAHANAVLRQQQAYQEVYDDVIAKATQVAADTGDSSPKAPKPAAPRRSRRAKRTDS